MKAMETEAPYFEQPERIFEDWEYRGLRCRVALGGHGPVGYVRLPNGHPSRGQSVDYSVHGGVTYGPDGAGWVGFDTAHAGDFWPEGDILSWAAMGFHERRIQMALEDARDEAIRKVPWAREWTLAQVRAEAEQLADQVIDSAGC